MYAFLYISVLAVLMLIFYQDMRYRGVSWFLFPAALLLLLGISFTERSLGVFWNESLLNLSFLGIQMLLLTVWFHFKKVSLRELWKNYIGLGDLLFFLVAALALPFPVFPLFMVFSLVLSVVLALVVFRGKTVPLAGLQSLFLALLYVMKPLVGFDLYQLNLMY